MTANNFPSQIYCEPPFEMRPTYSVFSRDLFNIVGWVVGTTTLVNNYHILNHNFIYDYITTMEKDSFTLVFKVYFHLRIVFFNKILYNNIYSNDMVVEWIVLLKDHHLTTIWFCLYYYNIVAKWFCYIMTEWKNK